mgnify:CR=1 FL=1
MATRTTKKTIESLESAINEVLERHGYPYRVFVQWAYGQPRAHTQPVGQTVVSDLSPRLPIGQMAMWLTAYLAGLSTGATLTEPPPEPAITDLSGDELRDLLIEKRDDEAWLEENKGAIMDRASDLMQTAAWVFDRATGVNPGRDSFGTKDKGSATYVVRQLCGYSYP